MNMVPLTFSQSHYTGFLFLFIFFNYFLHNILILLNNLAQYLQYFANIKYNIKLPCSSWSLFMVLFCFVLFFLHNYRTYPVPSDCKIPRTIPRGLAAQQRDRAARPSETSQVLAVTANWTNSGIHGSSQGFSEMGWWWWLNQSYIIIICENVLLHFFRAQLWMVE